MIETSAYILKQQIEALKTAVHNFEVAGRKVTDSVGYYQLALGQLKNVIARLESDRNEGMLP